MAMTAEITEEPVQPGQQPGDPAADEAPYGWMTDPDTGIRRPKKRPGRRPKAAALPNGPTPTLQELQALGSLQEASEDTAPSQSPRGRRRKGPAPELPPFRAGVISKGVNQLYRRAGRLIRLWDMDVGTAVIASTRPLDEEDVTVGDAWENLAKTNPRIRAFLLQLITGGAWTGLLTAHLPILMAIAMKPGIRERLPFASLANVLLTDDPPEAGGEPQPSDLAQMMGGITPDDMATVMAMGQMMMGQMANGVPRPASVPRDPAGEVREHPAAPE